MFQESTESQRELEVEPCISLLLISSSIMWNHVLLLTRREHYLSSWESLVLRWKPLQGTAIYEEVECWLKSTGLESEDLVSTSMSSTYNLCEAGQDHVMSGFPCPHLWSEREQMTSKGASQNRSTIVNEWANECKQDHSIQRKVR